MKNTAVWLTVAVALSGCMIGDFGGHRAEPSRYDPPNKPGGRMCSFQCRNAYDSCSEVCHLKERACTNEVQTQAIKDYEAYARDQYRAHLPVDLRPRDFERLESCAPTSCVASCRDHYDNCYEKCGGKVTRSSSCKALCF